MPQLRQDGAPAAALARSVGYSSESSLGNVFKRVMGVSPLGYRDAARAEEALVRR